MELNDPELPRAAHDWALTTDQIRAWAIQLDLNPEADPINALAQAMIEIIRSQSRIIGDLAKRISDLEQA